METRLIIAYALMLLMLVLSAGFIAYRIYHSRDRSYRRRMRKEERAYAARILSDGPQSPGED